MRAPKLINDRHSGSLPVFAQQERLEGYEQRLIRWGCPECKFFEKRVFGTGPNSDELDAYIICRFSEDPVDLIGEVTSCPKAGRIRSTGNQSKSGRPRLHCVSRV